MYAGGGGVFVDLDEGSPRHRHLMSPPFEDTIELQVEDDDEPSMITSIKEVAYGSPRSIEFSPEVAHPRIGYPTAHYIIPSHHMQRAIRSGMEVDDMEELVSQLQYALTSERDENARLRATISNSAPIQHNKAVCSTRATQTVEDRDGPTTQKNAPRLEELEAEVAALRIANRTSEDVARSNYTAAVEWEDVYGTLAKEHADLKVLLAEYRSVLDRLEVPHTLSTAVHTNVLLSESRRQRLDNSSTVSYPK